MRAAAYIRMMPHWKYCREQKIAINTVPVRVATSAAADGDGKPHMDQEFADCTINHLGEICGTSGDCTVTVTLFIYYYM